MPSRNGLRCGASLSHTCWMLRPVPGAEVLTVPAFRKKHVLETISSGIDKKSVRDNEAEYVVVRLPPAFRDRRGYKTTSFARFVVKSTVKSAVPVRFWRSDQTSRDFWLLRKQVFVTSDQRLTTDDVVALASEAENQRRLRLEKAHALQAMTAQLDSKKRTPIRQDVKVAVWQRDGGRCVECGLNEALEFDHIIPTSMGGANTMRNLQLLCEACNRRKGATLG